MISSGESDWDWAIKTTTVLSATTPVLLPNKVACPAHISVQGYLRMAAEGRYQMRLSW